TILALRAIENGFSDFIVGILYSAYFLGFIGGCRFGPRFIANVGHVRAFTAFASIASSATLAYALFDIAGAWLALRVITGFCMASLYMVLESWLNELSTNETRGRILSLYRITDFATLTLAQASVGLFNASAFPVFIVMSIAVSIALVPVSLTRVTQPDAPSTASLNIRKLWRVSPLAAASAVGIGLSASAFWGLSPVFVTENGYDNSIVGLFLAAIILGGAVAQWPLGSLSDKFDRRRVLMAVAAGGMVTSLMLPFAAQFGAGVLIAAGACFGIFALPNFGLAVAHANDHAEPGESVSVNGSLLMIYACAATLGPFLVPFLIPSLGANIVFFWVSAVYALLLAFGLYRMTQRASPEQQERYVAVPRTTPAVFELDPRTEEAEKNSVDIKAGAKPKPQEPG
ncbi:MAG: MFS transporter, partial [Pseudomonadota bacterium]